MADNTQQTFFGDDSDSFDGLEDSFDILSDGSADNLGGDIDESPEPFDSRADGVVVVIDGNSLAHRAFHAYERAGLTNSKGEPVFAIYGFMVLLAGILDKVTHRFGAPGRIVVGFDDHLHSERKATYSAYKANRSRKDESLYIQMDSISTLLELLGVHVVVHAGWEADDVCGSVAATSARAGMACVIATSDRDSFGLIDDNTTVLRLLSGLDNAVWMTPDELETRYGVTAGSYLAYAAVRGDVSDNLDGIPGVGEKRAAALCKAYSDLDAALADEAGLAGVVGKKGAASVIEHQDRVRRNLIMMAIRTDLPIDLERARLTASPEAIVATLNDWELTSLSRRVAIALCA